MTSTILHGTFPAIVTPFNTDGSLDLKSLTGVIEYVAQGGVTGIVVCGSTGEVATLSSEEYLTVLTHAREITRSLKITCIAGVSSNDTARAVEIAKVAKGVGVDLLMGTVPYYNKPPQEGLVEHFKAINMAADLPLIAYNVPGRTGLNLLPKTVATMVERGIVCGVKEASGNMEQFVELATLVGDKIALLSGEDGIVVPTMSVGGRGVISVTGNVAPRSVSKMVDAALNGDWNTAKKLQLHTLPLTHLMFSESNPIPVKTALHIKGIIKSARLRLPLVDAQPATLEKLKRYLSEFVDE